MQTATAGEEFLASFDFLTVLDFRKSVFHCVVWTV